MPHLPENVSYSAVSQYYVCETSCLCLSGQGTTTLRWVNGVHVSLAAIQQIACTPINHDQWASIFCSFCIIESHQKHSLMVSFVGTVIAGVYGPCKYRLEICERKMKNEFVFRDHNYYNMSTLGHCGAQPIHTKPLL